MMSGSQGGDMQLLHPEFLIAGDHSMIRESSRSQWVVVVGHFFFVLTAS
jgi:hypothetical protein